ncbi:MAG TPA: hypothetical protein VNN79_20700, partial [Actinomycetota bacterium]|nr:hypothetical protein [Actinomycetota bacterium]
MVVCVAKVDWSPAAPIAGRRGTRSRIPFERGSVSIHSLSAAAIEDVTITDGKTHPVRIDIHMNNSSGIYQV